MESTAPAGATIVGVDIFGPATRDAMRLVAFYRDALGMTPTALDESGRGAEFTLADGTAFGVWQPDEAPSASGYGALFAVTDINAAVARFRSSIGHKSEGLMFQVHHGLQQFVAGGDDLGIGLEGALRHDQISHLGREIDVGQFQRARGDGAQTRAPGHGRRAESAGIGHVGIKIVADAGQGLGVGEILQQHLAAREGSAVG